MKLILAFTLILCSQLTFGQKATKIIFPPPVLGIEYPEFTSACELPSHKKQLVYTRFIYEGVEEYWGLRPDKKCTNINANLVIPDNVIIRPEDLKQLKDAHAHYWKKYLILDLIGIFEDGNGSHYGHLGSNNSQFTVKYIIAVYPVDKSN